MDSWQTNYSGNDPLFRVGRAPVFVTTLVVALQVMALVGIAVAGYRSGLIHHLVYSAPAVQSGKLWTLATYAFVNDISFWTALGLVFFYFFGLRVEMRLGTRRYVFLLGVLILGPTIFLTLLCLPFGYSFLNPLPLGRLGGLGDFWSSINVHLSVFIAFVWLFSEAIFWPGVKAKWVGVFFVALQTLQLLGLRYWLYFWMCWFSLLLAYATLRWMGMAMKFAAIEEPLLDLIPKRKSRGYRSSKRKLRVVKGSKKRKPGKRRRHSYQSKLALEADLPVYGAAAASVDHLLEKISREGILSLTEAERKELEDASNQLSDTDKPSSS